MTFILVLMLGAGVILIISAIECTSIVQVTQDVWAGKVAGYTWQCQNTAGTPGGLQAIGSGPTVGPGGNVTTPSGAPYNPASHGESFQVPNPTYLAGPGASQLVPWVQNGWRG